MRISDWSSDVCSSDLASGERDVLFERSFEAPREAVFDGLTRPELVRQWMGPHGYHLVTCDIDLKVGGAYRYVIRQPDGSEMGWGGGFRALEIGRASGRERVVQNG